MVSKAAGRDKRRQRLALALCLCFAQSDALVINDWTGIPARGIYEDTLGNFTYDAQKAKDFVLQKSLFFINPRATLTITSSISGNWAAGAGGVAPCGIVFCASGANDQFNFNKGRINFYIDSAQMTSQDLGLFTLSNGAGLDSNADLSVNLVQGSNVGVGVFYVNNSNLALAGDLSLDAQGQNLFKAEGNSKITINQSGNRSKQNIALRGNIELGDDADFKLSLGNGASFFEGDINLSGKSKFELSLANSRARIEKYTAQNGASANLSLQNSNLNATLKATNTHLTLLSHSKWELREDSEIGNLKIQDSTVDLLMQRFGQLIAPKKLSAASLEGGGTFALYADLQSKQIDSLSFKKAEGKHIAEVYYNPHTFTQELAKSISEKDGLVLVSIDDVNSKAEFDGALTEIGILQYKTNLSKTTANAKTQWLISSIVEAGDSHIAQALSTALNSPYRLFEIMDSTLLLRLGDLRRYPKDYGLYLRYQIGLNQLQKTANTLETQDFWMNISAGFDMNKVYKNRVDFLGFGFDASLLDSKNSAYALSAQAYGANFYYTLIFDNRFYVDTILKYAFSPNEIDFKNIEDLEDKKKRFDAHLILASLDLGKKFGFGRARDFFYLEPQAKLTSGVILPSKLDLVQKQEKIEARLKTQVPLLTRATLYLGYEWNEELMGDLKLGSFVSYALNNGGEIVLRDPRSKLNKRFSADLDVGISAMGSIALKDFLRFYFELDSSFLGDYKSLIAFNAGLRFSFGERYVPPPPPPADPNRFKIRYKKQQITERTLPLIKEDELKQMKHYERLNGVPQGAIHSQSGSANRGKSQALEEERNKNRFYSRDQYVPLLETQKGYNPRDKREVKRDRYTPLEGRK